jgi:hypothetical protein
VTGFVDFSEFFACFRDGGGGAVFEIVDCAFEERVLVKEFDDSKRDAANCEDVHATILVSLYDFKDFCGAADPGDTVVEGEEHTEFGFVFEAIADHLSVARLENMQGKVSAGEKNDVKRE